MSPSTALAQAEFDPAQHGWVDGANLLEGVGESRSARFRAFRKTVFDVSCVYDNGPPSGDHTVRVTAFVEAAHAPENSLVTVQLLVGDTSIQINSRIQQKAGDYGYVYGQVSLDSPFVLALSTAHLIQMGIPGREYTPLDLASGRSAIDSWRQNCDELYGRSTSTPTQTTATQPQTPQVAQAPTPQPAAQAPIQQPIAPAQNAAPSQNAAPAQTGSDIGAAEALALGILGLGASIVVDTILLGHEETQNPQSQVPVGVEMGAGQRGELNVTIVSVRAVETTFGFGDDDLFLAFSNGARLPTGSSDSHSIGEGETWAPNFAVNASGGVEVGLWEYDTLNSSDLIGAFQVGAAFGEGRFIESVSGGGATYEVTFDVARNFNQPRQQTAQVIQTPRQAPQQSTARRRWSSQESGEFVTALDCSGDCNEDIGIIFLCQGIGLPAQVEVPWAWSSNGQSGAVLPLRVTVGRQVFSYNATVQGPGMVGYYPSFSVNPNDPMIDALQAGNSATIDFAGSSATFGLRGSRAALDRFQQQCGWNNVPQGTQFNQPAPVANNNFPAAPTLAAPQVAVLPAPTQADPALWFTQRFNDSQTGQAKSNLTFGIPESGAVGFNATCLPGSGLTTAEVDMIVDYGTLPFGTPMNTYIQVDGKTYQFQGQIFEDSSEWAGVRSFVDLRDPVWQAMGATTQPIAYGIFGSGRNVNASRGAALAVSQFLSSCQQQARVTAPVRQPAPQQPVLLPTPQSVAPPTNNGGQFTYACDDGSNLSVTLTQAGNSQVASVFQSNGSQFALIQVSTQVGTKFSNGTATLNVAGNTAQFTAPNTVLFCQGT